ncbi:MAG TPA: cytochrome c3 family protein [Thermoanaerobaculia bacterium]
MRMRLGGVLAAFLITATPLRAAAPPPPPKAPPNEDCFACHEDPSAKRANGSSIFVNKKLFEDSVHGAAGASCVDCHQDLARATEFPHPEKLSPVDCATCHAPQVEEYRKSVHAAERGKSKNSKAATCTDCHGIHDILPSKDAASRTNHFNLPTTCLRCHANIAVVPGAGGPALNQPALFHDSIHGKALEKSGLKFAPNCANCHGAHAIRDPKTDRESLVFRSNVPATCGSCHEKIIAEYGDSIHGTQLAKGNQKVPVCSDCHTAHAISAGSDARRLAILRECGGCHERQLKTYRDTYHGQVSAMGFSRVATCADCHTAHEIHPAGDARSSVGPAKRLATCQKCHPGVGASFAKYDPHADTHDRGRSQLLWATSLFMKILLVGVFAFFGIHTVLWFPRSVKARRETDAKKGGEA